jgi:hypothetical protein
MPARTLAETFCLKMQSDMDALTPSDFTTPIGMTQSLYTPENLRNGEQVQEEFDEQSGRAVTVYRDFYQRSGPTSVQNIAVNGPVNTCTPGTQKPIFTRSFEFDIARDTFTHKITISDTVMRQYCGGDTKGDRVTKLIKSSLNAMYVRLNDHFVTQFVALAGGYVGGGAVLNGSAFVGGVIDSTINSLPDVIRQEYENAEMNDQPFLVSWGLGKEYYRKAQFGCCNDDGINVNEATNYGRLFKDLSVPRLLTPNTNRLLTYMPGTFVPMEYNWYSANGDFNYKPQGEAGNAFNFNSHDDLNIQIVDNSGLFSVPFTFDVTLRHSNCDLNSTWVITLIKTAALMDVIPPDAFSNAGERLVGVNGGMIFNATSV